MIDEENARELIEDYWELVDQFETLKMQKRAMEEAMVNLLHPLKVGDIVRVNTFSHNGKLMVVERRYFNGQQFTATGPVLKKDNTPGKQQGLWMVKDRFHKVDPEKRVEEILAQATMKVETE